jgi:hypothetical protein
MINGRESFESFVENNEALKNLFCYLDGKFEVREKIPSEKN